MKRSFLIKAAGCLAAAAIAYFWATSLMDSMYAYRSPLRTNPPAPGSTTGEPATRRVILVLVDALREDTALNPQVMPYLNELRHEAAYATMHSRPSSFSEPSYSTLFTGAWPDVNDGPALNLDYEEIPTWTQDNLFSAAHRSGLRTAISGYYWFEKLVPQEAVQASYYTPGEDQAADRLVVDAALPWLQANDYQLVLIHLDQVDYAGHHEGGPLDPRWDAAATRADSLLREIGEALDLGQDTLVVFSDHGQIDPGGHGGHDPVTLVEPFVMAGAGVKPGDYGNILMVDVAPTLAALLGANIPASSQGQPHLDMLELPAGQEQAVVSELEVQQSRLLEAYQTAIGVQAAVEPGGETVPAHQAALEQARQMRLNRERLPRAVLALALALAPAVYLFRRRSRRVAWLLGGALLYLVLFNLRYALIDQRAYSLSTILSSMEIIVYTAVTALGALLVSWLVVSLGLGLFKKPPLEAAHRALDLALLTVYLLSLPVLWSYTLNGALVGWTLPDFATMYLGFLSLVQILFVAAGGLLFAGLAALAATLAGRRAPALSRETV